MNDDLILVDLDGVVVDLMGEALRRGLFDHYPFRWEFTGCCTRHEQNHIFEHLGLFEAAEPIAGALEAIEDLASAGLRVHFLSTPWPTAPWSAHAKYEWVEFHFGDPRMLTLTHDKTLVPGRLLVDDRPGLVGPWEHIVYPQPWNTSTLPSWAGGLADHIITRAGQ